MLSIILGILIFIGAIYLFVLIIGFVIGLLMYLIPIAIVIVIAFWIISTWGWGAFIGVIAIFIVIGIIGNIYQMRERERAKKMLSKYFVTYEMADYGDLRKTLSSGKEKYLDELLQTFVSEGKVERIYLNQDVLYKWIASTHFKKGVVRKEIQID